MNREIGIYAPNLSKDNLIALLYLQVNDPESKIMLEILKPTLEFRSAEMKVALREPDTALLHSFVVNLFNVARTLGGTRFVFKNGDRPIKEAYSNISDSYLKLLGEEISRTDFNKIEIY